MSKAKRMREMQEELNNLTNENQALKKKLKSIYDRHKALLGDNVKKPQEIHNEKREMYLRK